MLPGTPAPVNCAIHPDVVSRTCNGNSYAGYNGNFETPGRRPETPADWMPATYGGRVTAPASPAINNGSLQLRTTGAGVGVPIFSQRQKPHLCSK